MVSTGIYKITSPSNKIYIGQSLNINKRWRENYFTIKCKNQQKLYYSLKKYGPENHIFEIIEECSSEKLDEREIYWIDFYDCVKEGLNIRYGGKGGRLNEETKNKISKSNTGISRNKGRIQSNKEREKRSGRIQDEKEKKMRSDIRKGYKPTSNHIENMRLSMLGKNTKSIQCINTGDIYNSIREAANILGLNERSISNNLCGLSNTLKNGLKFKYC